MTPGLSDIAGLRASTREAPAVARLLAQAEAVTRKDSSNGKPYYELRLRDAGGSLILRAWSDTSAFATCQRLAPGAAVAVEGEFYSNGSFGLDAKRWTLTPLAGAEAEEFFAGGEEARAKTAADLAGINALVASIADPRLRAVCEKFLADHGPRFARAAAARANHHARRGGLLEHTARMMSAADAICRAYPSLNRDLLLAGTLLHDCGKLWETCPPEKGFDVPRDLRGELLGHISIGIELVNTLWRSLPLDDWKDAAPPSESVRLHLLHLLAAHHGQLEFGSPVEPKTPEAVALHHIDNLDAKLEMLRGALEGSPEVAPAIHEKVRALGIHPVRPLEPFSASPPAQTR